MNERLCIDCKHRHKEWWDLSNSYLKCKEPRFQSINPVTGKKIWIVRLCEDERAKHIGRCGPSGLNWLDRKARR